MASTLLGNSIKYKMGCLMPIPFGYSCADWDGFCDHLRDVPWEDVFEHSASLTFFSFMAPF